MKGSRPAGTAFVGGGGGAQSTKGSSEIGLFMEDVLVGASGSAFKDGRCSWEREVRDKDAQRLENKSELRGA